MKLLASKQVLLEQEREKKVRRCNVILDNVSEQAGEILNFADVKEKASGVCLETA